LSEIEVLPMKTPVITRKNLPNCRVKLTVPITVAHFKPAFKKELEAVAQDVKIEGFRPGKAPLDRVLATVGRQRIEAGALDRALNTAYIEALKQENLVPVTQPEVAIESYTAPAEDAADTDQVAMFTAELDVLPEVSVKGYEKIKVKQPKRIEVEQKDIDDVIDYLRKQGSKLEDTGEDTVAAKGMWADIMFKGSVDGVAREDMHSANHPLVIGEGQLIPGFEEHIIGLKKGEEKTFDITFPKQYHSKDLQGKKAQFTVKINELKDVQLPVLDAEFAKKFGHDSMEKLEKAIRENLEQERTEEQKTALENVVIDELLKLTKFDVPASLVQQEENRLTQETMQRLGGQPLNDELQKQVKEQAPKNVKIGLALGKIIELEKIDDKEQPMRIAVDKLIAIATR
jgi:trigger factor